ncbi:hypothetical protein K503DRAFT_866930 [Rhizopogon vinicolor AM-OR11-026]|uniref:Uncharacterized protein n=1 Tax=Rhizopogon vinicolor AM-OR11-026 TaxID=1314800 RepID=A0A1B7MXM8_9AGAM|nr:hypothetical protein K503DRAFT_866930 [Rhizopogon vinicolor AM-OR11-026]
MLTPLALFTVALASSILGATIPTTPLTSTDAAEPHRDKGSADALWRNIHTTATPTAQAGQLSAFRRSGELWEGIEHEEIATASSTPSRRSGELWAGIEHEEIASASSTPSRRSGELWEGIEHEEVTDL